MTQGALGVRRLIRPGKLRAANLVGAPTWDATPAPASPARGPGEVPAQKGDP